MAAARHSEHALQAARNTLKLGSSLLVTIAIALVARVIVLPRYLGPDQFGVLNFAEALTTAVFVLLSFGAETYVQKEIAVRPEHANDFYGGLLLVRLLALPVLLLGMGGVLWRTGQLEQAWLLVTLLAAWQLLFQQNNTLAALLRAKGDVDGLSVQNVLTKVLWGVGMVGAAMAGLGLPAIALAYLGSEAIKTLALSRLVRRHLQLRLRWDGGAVRRMLADSLPFYVNALALVGYGNIDRLVLRFVVGEDREVGWYAAASNLGGLALLLTPLLNWVLMPLFARARAQSEEEFFSILRRSVELVVAFALPLSLALGLGADLWVRISGGAFGPAALSLQILSPIYAVTYLCTLAAQGLIIIGRGWHVTAISVGSLVLNVLAAAVLIGPVRQLLGFAPGAGAAGAATAVLLTELSVGAAMLYFLGGRLLEARTVGRIARNLAACAVTVGVHLAAARFGHLRLLLDAGVYLVLLVVLRAVPFAELRTFLAQALRRRQAEEAVTPPA